MKPVVTYVIAAVLVAASVPLYWVVLHPPGRLVVNAIPSRQAEAAVVPARTQRYLDPNELAADIELRRGGARCVAGVVYRTFSHVIEPWPGNVRCAGDPGIVLR